MPASSMPSAPVWAASANRIFMRLCGAPKRVNIGPNFEIRIVSGVLGLAPRTQAADGTDKTGSAGDNDERLQGSATHSRGDCRGRPLHSRRTGGVDNRDARL